MRGVLIQGVYLLMSLANRFKLRKVADENKPEIKDKYVIKAIGKEGYS